MLGPNAHPFADGLEVVQLLFKHVFQKRGLIDAQCARHIRQGAQQGPRGGQYRVDCLLGFLDTLLDRLALDLSWFVGSSGGGRAYRLGARLRCWLLHQIASRCAC